MRVIIDAQLIGLIRISVLFWHARVRLLTDVPLFPGFKV